MHPFIILCGIFALLFGTSSEFSLGKLLQLRVNGDKNEASSVMSRNVVDEFNPKCNNFKPTACRTCFTIDVST